jgi:FG-GAP-like repeat/Secretion system C-terminal sorting domain
MRFATMRVCIASVILLHATIQISSAQIEWIEHQVDANFDHPSSVYATDVDGDGDIDILGAGKYSGDINWWENADGGGLEWVEHTLATDFDRVPSVYATDVDGDGDTDVLSGAFWAGEITWWENADGVGLEWVEHTIDGNFDGAYCVYAADIDGDGDTDVLGAASEADEITWWENADGGGLEWVEHTLATDFNRAYSVYASDVDGDGDMDIIGAAYTDDDVAWWENTDGGGQEWEVHEVDYHYNGATSVRAADVDGDGDTDILAISIRNDVITWWENVEGNGLSWTEHTIEGDFNFVSCFCTTDLDGDGDIDVLAGTERTNFISWWENVDGDGLNWTRHEVDWVIDGFNSVFATDIDADGDIDVIGAIFETDEIVWWDQVNLAPQIEVSLTPYLTTIPATGGQLHFSVSITNRTDTWQIGTAWTEVIMPDDNLIGPLELMNITAPVGTITTDILSQIVPAYSPAGLYQFNIKLGAMNQGIVVASDSLSFTKLLPQVEVSLTLYETTIPAAGGQLRFSVSITNRTDTWQVGTAWTEVIIPGDNLISPLELRNITAPVGTITSDTLSQIVPGYSPEGLYQFSIKLGATNQEIVVASDSLYFIKTGWTSSQFNEWDSSPLLFSSEAVEQSGQYLPSAYKMSAAYPNPFNPTTSLAIDLPEAADLSVVVFNVSGRLVTTLAGGQHMAGTHTVTFDASGMASGLYFVRATVPGQLDEVQKVMLVR